MRLSALAKQMETAGRQGNLEAMVDVVRQFEDEFNAVKLALEALKRAPEKFIGQER